MDGNKFLTKAIEIVKQAVDCDNKGDFPNALNYYKQALDYFVTGLKYEKNPRTKKAISEKCETYMKRAEELKKQIQDGPAKKPVVAHDGAAGKDSGSGGAEDKADDPLNKAIASAIVREKPNVKWDDVAGLDKAKTTLKEAVILPIKFPQLFVGKRQPWRGILLYGPPGTGKSYLAKAVATEANNSTFLSVSSSDLVSKFQGESERLVKALFEMARAEKPAIIFIDEIDSLCGSRSDGENESSRRIKTEFLVQMQGVGKSNDGILVLGATNTPWSLDAAIRRRFEKRIYIPLPELDARKSMFKLHLGNTPNNLAPEDFITLSKHTDGYSGSDISIVVRDAIMEPVRKLQRATHFKENKDGKLEMCDPNAPGAKAMSLMDIPTDKLITPEVTLDDFVKVMKTSKSSVSQADLKAQEDWTKEFGMEGA